MAVFRPADYAHPHPYPADDTKATHKISSRPLIGQAPPAFRQNLANSERINRVYPSGLDSMQLD